ncbi:hypothetical protein [Streptomyces justiciae]|uniref:Uncharacterized protein n=1 Tax=Streptomyces justiciae TaxID=2780140 RepID=A0ABU3M723_9ACTN|nr:hypothetical protein [Streptomyces justiciae]MDT7847183.1 hypothetical protein [Streptomyces justiciae]
MSTTYTNSDTIYTLQANGPTVFGAFSVTVARQSFGYSEADVDAAMQAFTDVLNASGQVQIDKVVKIFEASGASDWTYEPA